MEEELSIEMIAAKLHVDPSTVWRWIRAGKIKPVRKLGRRIVRVPLSAVDAFLKERTV